uniref:Uncharacterized protein n=1 Tax=Opuntia streptacantha TaxID=393608 RepID=A0A7C9DLX3_OPUST
MKKRRVANPRASSRGESLDSDSEIRTLNQIDHPLSYIPQCLLIEEVFPRLPVKSLLRYKSLSKQWNSIISSPQFTQLHLSHSSSQIRYLLIDAQGNLHIHDNDDGLRRFEGQIQTDFNARVTEPVGSCNGLVCSAQGVRGSDYYFIWNPSTAQFRKIPSPCNIPNDSMIFRGFGYVSSIDDYKLVQAIYSDELWPDCFVMSIFSFRTGVWKHLSAPEKSNELICCRFDDACSVLHIRPGTALVNETLHWLGFAFCCGDMDSQLLAFDLVKEDITNIPPPPNVVSDLSSGDAFVSVFEECLCLCNLYKNQGLVEMWVLEEYGDWESWKKLIKVELGMGLVSSKLPNWNLFGGLEKKILVRPSGGSPHLFVDLSHDPPKMVSLPNDLYLSFAISYVESLVSPFPPLENDGTVGQLF